MKALKYILAILAILIIGFFAIGMINPTVEYDCQLTVEKSLAESWAVSQDEEKMADWLIGYEKMEMVSGEPGTVGAVSDIYFKAEGEEMIIRETILEIVPNESISMSFESEFMNMDYQLIMNAVEGKTEIISKTNARGNGMLSKSIMALISGSLKAQEETNLGLLKKTIENNDSDYSQE